MTFATQVLSSDRHAQIARVGSMQGSYLDIPDFPVDVYNDMRLSAYVRGNWDDAPIFSVFLSPETFSAKRDVWERAKTEAETIFEKAHLLVEARERHNMKMQELRDARLREIRCMFPVSVQLLEDVPIETYLVSNFLDTHGNKSSVMISFFPYSSYRDETYRVYTYSVTAPGGLDRDSFIESDNSAETLQKIITIMASRGANVMLCDEEDYALNHGITLPWQVPFDAEAYSAAN